MQAQPPGGRELKRMVARLLAGNGPAGLGPVAHLPGRRLVNPLFALFCDADERVRWHAVTAMGEVTARLAEENMESARVVLRRCMWNLNEESGGIGWGCAEAMGETLARSPALAGEYGCILTAYLDPCGNFIDHPALQEGVLWGVGRLAQAQPAIAVTAARLLLPFLSEPAPALRGLAAWAAGSLAHPELTAALERLGGDEAVFTLYEAGRLGRPTVGEVARRALARATAV
jgi:hypothetical protein